MKIEIRKKNSKIFRKFFTTKIDLDFGKFWKFWEFSKKIQKFGKFFSIFDVFSIGLIKILKKIEKNVKFLKNLKNFFFDFYVFSFVSQNFKKYPRTPPFGENFGYMITLMAVPRDFDHFWHFFFMAKNTPNFFDVLF